MTPIAMTGVLISLSRAPRLGRTNRQALHRVSLTTGNSAQDQRKTVQLRVSCMPDRKVVNYLSDRKAVNCMGDRRAVN